MYMYMYIFKGKRGMRTHSCYDHYLTIGQLVNGRYREIQDQILIVQRQTKEEWILFTKFLFNLLYFNYYPYDF